jgi:HEPN domain-containing protein
MEWFNKNSDKSKFYKNATFFSTQEVMKYLKEAGFGIARIKQTLIPGDLQEIISDGFGKGAFVVIKGVK